LARRSPARQDKNTTVLGRRPNLARSLTRHRPPPPARRQVHNKRALLLAAQFLHEELPIRLARRVRELKKLPYGLSETKSITQVRKLYEKSFFEIRRHAKPTTPDLEAGFTKVMDAMMVEHQNVQATIAAGLQELHRSRQEAVQLSDPPVPFDFGQFLDRFYLSRVGMRVRPRAPRARCAPSLAPAPAPRRREPRAAAGAHRARAGGRF